MSEPAKDLSAEKLLLLQRRLKGDARKTAPVDAILPRNRPDAGVLSAPENGTAPAPEKIPLSFAEERLWLLDRLDPGTSLYNIPFGLTLKGRLDVAVLQHSLGEILRRHEILRTRFESENGRPLQIIGPAVPVEMPVDDLSALPEAARKDQLQGVCHTESRRPFDLQKDLLFRARLFRLGPAEHFLFLNLHHIAADGWSVGILLRELTVLYQESITARPSSLPQLTIQYADFAVWQRERLQGEALARQVDYWKKQLDGAPALVELPGDKLRPPKPTYGGAEVALDLPRALVEKLNAFARQENTTLFNTMLAAYYVLLQRYTGLDDLPVGTPIAGRNWAEIEGLIGFFVNTLVLRGDLSGDPSFRELLKRTHELALGAYSHQDVPFELLVKELRPKRNLSYSPLFQVMFLLLDLQYEATKMGGLEVTTKFFENGTSKFDLTFAVRKTGKDLQMVAEYNTDLFLPETILQMLRQYQTLLEGIVENPARRLSELPLLTPDDLHHILVEWNATPDGEPQKSCVHELFQARAEASPEAVALVFEKQQLTYHELNEQANQLAHHLQKLGVGPDSLVAIYAERSLAMVIGLLAILKAGGAYVPMDAQYPRERLAFMLEDTRASVIVTQKALAADLPPTAAKVICIDSDWETISNAPKTNPANAVQPQHLAYIIYTSGSTGRPKGVQITHRGLTHSNQARQTYYDRSPESFLLLSSHAFDSSVAGIFWTLSQGGRLVLPSPGQERDPAELVRIIAQHRISHLLCLPTLYELLLLAADDSKSLGSLQVVIVAGEPCPTELTSQHRRKAASARLYNEYGPTENTVWATVFEIRETFSGRVVPIGRPIPDVTCYVLDPHLQPVPVGVPGELYLGGNGLARGYLNQPELTAEKFVTNPFSTGLQSGVSESHLYKTGDLVRYLRDGNLEFLGRIDHQVKIRGFRIELGEVETVLSTHPNLLNVAVIAREDVPGEKILTAYMVVKREPAPTILELRQFLLGKLPAYMLPAAFVALPALPQTPNGKVDRKNLPAPDQNRLATGVEFIAPRTPLEIELARIWCDVLGLKQVSLNDNFFELGGHSLLAIRLLSEINRVLKYDLPVRSLFQSPTIEELLKQLPVQTGKKGGKQQPELIQLQAGKASPEIFFLIDEGSLSLFKLARTMDPELSLYASLVPLSESALRASANRQFDTLPRMEELAAKHAALILAHKSNAPLVLAGHCFGGLLAFEVAHQLQRAGKKVDAVLMLDTWMTEPNFWWQKKVWLQTHLQKLFQHGSQYLWKKSLRRITLGRENLASRLDLAGDDNFSDHVPWIIIERIYRHARAGYRPQPLANRGVLFVSQEDWLSNAYRQLDGSLGTGKWYQGGVEIIDVPGDHVTVLDEPHLRELADGLRKGLEKLRSKSAPSKDLSLQAA